MHLPKSNLAKKRIIAGELEVKRRVGVKERQEQILVVSRETEKTFPLLEEIQKIIEATRILAENPMLKNLEQHMILQE